MLELREYQRKAIDSIYRFFEVNPTGHPVLEAPTGSGKSLIQADFIREVLARWPNQRFLCITHVKELVEQNYLELCGQWPMAPAGIYSAGLKRRDTSFPIIFGSVQSMYQRALEFGRIDLLFIDECHLCPVKTSTGQYRTLIDALLEINPHMKVIGLTATPYRLDNGSLVHGDNALFTDIIPAKANGMSVADLLAEGHLAPLTNEAVRTAISTEGVKKRGGDFVLSDLEAVVDVDHITQAACDEIVHFGQQRKSWLIFATSVQHAHHIAEALKHRGILAKVVTGNTPGGERDAIIGEFKAQQLRCLINVNCLTTGFNARCVDLIAFLRPTESPALYVQMAGRGLRLSPETGKVDCLVLDFAGLIDQHGPITDVRPPKNKRKGEGGAPPVKECENCFMLIHAAARVCDYCGHEIPLEEMDSAPAIQAQASTTDILGREFGIHAIERMTFRVHTKEGAAPSLRVDYLEGFKIAASEWVCFFHEKAFPRSKAQQWWLQHMPEGLNTHLPPDIAGALQLAEAHARCPKTIRVKPDGNFTRVVSKTFDVNHTPDNAVAPAPSAISGLNFRAF